MTMIPEFDGRQRLTADIANEIRRQAMRSRGVIWPSAPAKSVSLGSTGHCTDVSGDLATDGSGGGDADDDPTSAELVEVDSPLVKLGNYYTASTQTWSDSAQAWASDRSVFFLPANDEYPRAGWRYMAKKVDTTDLGIDVYSREAGRSATLSTRVVGKNYHQFGVHSFLIKWEKERTSAPATTYFNVWDTGGFFNTASPEINQSRLFAPVAGYYLVHAQIVFDQTFTLPPIDKGWLGPFWPGYSLYGGYTAIWHGAVTDVVIPDDTTRVVDSRYILRDMGGQQIDLCGQIAMKAGDAVYVYSTPIAILYNTFFSMTLLSRSINVGVGGGTFP